MRIHGSTIVQVDRIAGLVAEFHGDFTVRLEDGTSLALSRTRSHLGCWPCRHAGAPHAQPLNFPILGPRLG